MTARFDTDEYVVVVKPEPYVVNEAFYFQSFHQAVDCAQSYSAKGNTVAICKLTHVAAPFQCLSEVSTAA